MINFSESFYKFLREQRGNGSRIATLIVDARNLWHEYPIYQRVITNKEIDYITMRADGMVSYLPAGKEHKVNERGEWQRDGRQAGRAGKVIRKIFTEKALRTIKNSEFESFGNAYKAKFLDNGFQFEIRPNTEIPNVYCMRRADGEASLGGSCMNNDKSYLELYAKCKSLRIVILINRDGSLCGRALLWSVTHDDHGDMTFMDRIYVAEDYMYDIFLNYAKEQGWWRKSVYKSFDSKMYWIHPETDEQHKIKVVVKTSTDCMEYPYIDTFAYGNDGFLTNSDIDDYQYTYNETDGRRGGDEEEEDDHEGESYDEIRGEWISDDDSVGLSSYGSRRYRDKYVHIDDTHHALVSGSRHRGEWEYFHENDDKTVDIGGTWYYIEHEGICLRADEEWDLRDNCVYCETDGKMYESDDHNMIQTNYGDYRHKYDDDDVVYVEDKDGDSEGTFHYLPDIEDETILIENGERHWKKATCIKKVELHRGATCGHVWALKIDLLKWRNKIYHKDDIRIENKPTRQAYPL